jgi:hypothetical protein
MNFCKLWFLTGFVLQLVPGFAQEKQDKEYWFWASQGDSAMFANNPRLANEYFYKAFAFRAPYNHHLYGMAGNFASLSQIDSSFKYLELAIKGGFKNLDNIENFEVFDILHPDPRWNQLLEPVRQERAVRLKAEGVNMEIYRTLTEAAKAEQRLRHQLISPKYTGAQKDSIGQVLMKVDQANLANLKTIVQQYGWPTPKIAGKEGANAAWLIVQHADRDVAFQKTCLALMKKHLKEEWMNKSNYAYLVDRTRVNEGQKQVYGTQMGPNGQPFPIENASQVDERRQQMGMGPLADYVKLFPQRN